VHIERERRFRLSESDYRRLLGTLTWGPPSSVIDVTLGRHGATSMETDGWVVRLRSDAGRARLQFKGRLAGTDGFLEADVGVDSLPDAAEILSLLGLKIDLVIARIRRQATVAGVRLALDDVTCLGPFLEVEALGETIPDLPSHLVDHVDATAECRSYGDLILERLRTSTDWATVYNRESKRCLAGLQLVTSGMVEDPWLMDP